MENSWQEVILEQTPKSNVQKIDSIGISSQKKIIQQAYTSLGRSCEALPNMWIQKLKRFHAFWVPGLSPPTTPQLANGFGKWKKHVTPNCQHICLRIPASKFTFFCASKSAGSSKWTLFGFRILATQSLFVNPPWEKTSQRHPCDTLTEQLSPFVLSWHCWKGLEKCISVFEISVVLECFRCHCLRYCWEQVGANNSMLSVFNPLVSWNYTWTITFCSI